MELEGEAGLPARGQVGQMNSLQVGEEFYPHLEGQVDT